MVILMSSFLEMKWSTLSDVRMVKLVLRCWSNYLRAPLHRSKFYQKCTWAKFWGLWGVLIRRYRKHDQNSSYGLSYVFGILIVRTCLFVCFLFFFFVSCKEIVGHSLWDNKTHPQDLFCATFCPASKTYSVISDKSSILPDISFPLFLHLLTDFLIEHFYNFNLKLENMH